MGNKFLKAVPKYPVPSSPPNRGVPVSEIPPEIRERDTEWAKDVREAWIISQQELRNESQEPFEDQTIPAGFQPPVENPEEQILANLSENSLRTRKHRAGTINEQRVFELLTLHRLDPTLWTIEKLGEKYRVPPIVLRRVIRYTGAPIMVKFSGNKTVSGHWFVPPGGKEVIFDPNDLK